MTLGGMRETGRQIRGPASNIVELESDSGQAHLAIVFGEKYRDHESLTRAVELAISFLQFPMVAGVVELKEHIPAEGAFIYPTGPVWTLTEVIRAIKEGGSAMGTRAGMDLTYLAAGILQEAAENGPVQGVFSHGGLTPDRILIDGNGMVSLLGYGLPQIEVRAWLEDQSQLIPREDSWAYCPPERITGAGEDVDADLYALSLIAWEVMTGRTLYSGKPEEMHQQASRGEGALELRQLKRSSVPKGVRDFLITAMEFDPAQRYEDGHDFLRVLYETFTEHELPGASLADIMEHLGPMPKRGKALVSAAKGAVSAGKAAKKVRRGPPPRGLGAPVHRGPGGRPAAAPAADDSRWGKVRRGQEEEAPGRTSRGRRLSGPAEEEEKPKRRVPRRAPRKSAKAEEEAKPARRAPRRKPRKAAEEPEETKPARRAPRRKPSRATEEPAEEAKPARRAPRRTPRRAKADEPSEKPAPKRRTPRRSPRKAAEEEPAEEAKPKRRTPRRSPRSSSSGDEESKPKRRAPRRVPRKTSKD